MCCMRTVRQLLLLLWRRDGGTERLSNLPQATQLEMVNPCLNRSCLTPEPQLVYKLRAWFLCHCDSLWSLPAWLGFPPCMGSPKAASPQLKRGQDRQGAQPESPSGWAATLGIRPHPHSWTYGSHRWGSEALGNRQERAPQQETLGAWPAKPGGFRRLLAWLPVQLGSPAHAVPSLHDLPQLGPSSQAQVTWCRSVPLWGRAGCQEQPGGGHTPREWSESSLAERPLCTGVGWTSTCGHSASPTLHRPYELPTHLAGWPSTHSPPYPPSRQIFTHALRVCVGAKLMSGLEPAVSGLAQLCPTPAIRSWTGSCLSACGS